MEENKIEHTLSAEDMAANPELADAGVAVGDTIEIPEVNAKGPTDEQVRVFASRFNIDLTDGTQTPGVVGSLVDLLNGRGTLPPWMPDEPCFAELVHERSQPPAVGGEVA